MRNELFGINLFNFWNEEGWYFIIWKFRRGIGGVFLGVCGIRRRRVGVVLVSVGWNSGGGVGWWWGSWFSTFVGEILFLFFVRCSGIIVGVCGRVYLICAVLYRCGLPPGPDASDCAYGWRV